MWGFVFSSLPLLAATKVIGEHNGSRKERDATVESSFVMLKPDALRRGLVFQIAERLQAKGLVPVHIQLLTPGREVIEEHYKIHENKDFFPGLVDYVASGPVIASIWEGPDAIQTIRTLVGNRDIPGTIRGDYQIDLMTENLIHASDAPEAAVIEKAVWLEAGRLALAMKSDESVEEVLALGGGDL